MSNFKLTQAEANAPRPKRPTSSRFIDWEYYYIDLACWKATQAEKLLSGVEDYE
jgi:hypothetical protein